MDKVHEFWELVQNHFPNPEKGKIETVISNGSVDKYTLFIVNSGNENTDNETAKHDQLSRTECRLLRQIISLLQISCFCEWHYSPRGFFNVTVKKLNFNLRAIRKLIEFFEELNLISRER